MQPDSTFRWTRTPPAAWQAVVRRWSPITSHQAHLQLWWEPGAPEQPVGRWTLYECTPRQYVHDLKLGLLFAVRPCTCAMEGQILRTCKRCGGIQSYGRKRIQEYLERTGFLALPFWVIQGSKGGHKVEYDETEASWDRLRGGSGEAPIPGSLPYAPFDDRVLTALRMHDRLRSAYRRMQTAYGANLLSAEIAFRKAWSAWVDRDMEETVDQVWKVLPDLDVPIREGPLPDYERLEEEYVNTGAIPASTGTFQHDRTLKLTE